MYLRWISMILTLKRFKGCRGCQTFSVAAEEEVLALNRKRAIKDREASYCEWRMNF